MKQNSSASSQMKSIYRTPIKRVFLLVFTLLSSAELVLHAQLKLPWEEEKNSKPPGTMSPPDAEAGAHGLIESGDFTNSIPTGIEGDGGRWEGPNAGNWSWRLAGPGDMAISIPLKPSPGFGKLTVSFQMAIPEGTPIDPAIGGIRVRTRLMDRYKSSAVADILLQPASTWQPVKQIFEDTASGPYTLWIEALGFTGSVYLDQISVIPGDGAAMSPPPGAPGLSKQEGKVPVETWFAKQPWMAELSEGLPPGVTLEVFSAEMAGSETHYAVEVRENHAPGSGFDPGEAPRWGIFQVSRDLTEVFYLSPVTDRLEPVRVFQAEAKLRLAALTGAKSKMAGKADESELEQWVRKQDWFQKLETRMPKGVELIILERDDGFEGWTAFEIREQHAAESGFDPDVLPLVGLFEVSPTRDGVAWFDSVTDEWQPIEDFLASRGGER